MTVFKSPFSGVPVPPAKKQLAQAAVMFLMKYRAYHNIPVTQQLTAEQLEEILDGVRDFFYEHEEIRFTSDDDDDLLDNHV